jgi:hypothetical protein
MTGFVFTLPSAPRTYLRLLLLDASKLLESFGPRVRMVDPSSGKNTTCVWSIEETRAPRSRLYCSKPRLVVPPQSTIASKRHHMS